MKIVSERYRKRNLCSSNTEQDAGIHSSGTGYSTSNDHGAEKNDMMYRNNTVRMDIGQRSADIPIGREVSGKHGYGIFDTLEYGALTLLRTT